MVPIACAAILSCAEENRVEEGAKPVPVRTVTVAAETVRIPVHTSGIVSRKEQMALSFMVGGIVGHIHVDEGDSVREGDLLAALDPTEIEARTRQAQVGLEKARRDLRRVEKLHADSVATLEQLQDATSALQNAEAVLEIAKHNRRFSSIRAPGDGRILKRLAEVHELAAPGRPVLMFSSTKSQFVLRVGLADRDIVRLSPGDSASVVFDAFPECLLAGAVSELPAGANPATGLYEVELTVEEEGLPLLTGLIGRAEILSSSARRLPVIPIEALMDVDADRGFAYVVEEGSAEKRPLRLGPILGAKVVVLKGLSPGEDVVTAGAAYLRDGLAVTVVEGTSGL
jgi:RND family efflux transporter MFP subunit